jgi:tetratricopeptide (TPR) repeat protein
MSNRSTDELFQLIKSLEKAEKRNFKLFVKRNAGSDDLKMVTLFDALDGMHHYDEGLLLQKSPDLKKQQLSNLKAHLYKQILTSLRFTKDDHVEMQLNEQMSYARILYNKGLYHQSLKLLEKIKQLAVQNNQVTFQMQALIFEKKIEVLHITRSMENRASQLSHEVETANTRLTLINKLSNLSLQLYSWYIKMGHARDEKDVEAVKMFFEMNLPAYHVPEMQFYEKIYLYQSYCWYGFILQDLLMYYRYTQKWVNLFEKEPFMKGIETGQYIKGMHNLLSAHFSLENYEGFNKALGEFEEFAVSEEANSNANVRIQTFLYLNTARINKHFLEGTFTEGLELAPLLEEKLEEYKLQLDRHRILVFYYKIACLYFGSGDNEKAIDYLNRIINLKVDLRTDLQCYARLLHLIAHYELGNWDILEYLIKSVYRFMANMKNLSVVEEEIFKFLRKSFSLAPQRMIPAFKALKEKLERYQGSPLEARSFMYLDIISWLQSKIQGVPVQQVRRDLYKKGRGQKKEK